MTAGRSWGSSFPARVWTVCCHLSLGLAEPEILGGKALQVTKGVAAADFQRLRATLRNLSAGYTLPCGNADCCSCVIACLGFGHCCHCCKS